ncbi:hypothetical protein [Streptomyces albireticuli]|uniref:Uncharacterized protein n=1 Tax=Streptomyces albireticuli TaxID=1940 RepID=A0A2A2D832_9ACTN|nr:hypothetical protein [Streptomyces albireticuli]MCD9140610.1 hypothetical protein [Streptomyces albireticuli]MCD9161428.1 hypothetical protein [Streptomyces albireticuli]MCD9193002.1 hypothetical protein [Streptomyces albireticuli]PAU47606.1 hypothetical protein CK936_17770 [Streptomyces albireticuli]
MATTLTRPAPERVAERAREILSTMEADQEFERLWRTCAQYSSDWDDFYGYPIIPDYDAVGDAPQLFKETIRTMAIKSAVYDLMDGDETTATTPTSVTGRLSGRSTNGSGSAVRRPNGAGKCWTRCTPGSASPSAGKG